MSTPDYSQPDLNLLGPEHVRRYQETDGAVGYLWNGVPITAAHHDGPEKRATSHDPAHLRPRR